MTDSEAIDEAIRRTGVERYRFLCSAGNPHPSPNSAADHIRLMHEIAAKPSPAAAEWTFEQMEEARIAYEANPPETRKRCCGG